MKATLMANIPPIMATIIDPITAGVLHHLCTNPVSPSGCFADTDFLGIAIVCCRPGSPSEGNKRVILKPMKSRKNEIGLSADYQRGNCPDYKVPQHKDCCQGYPNTTVVIN
jgi:hypothetical protein